MTTRVLIVDDNRFLSELTRVSRSRRPGSRWTRRVVDLVDRCRSGHPDLVIADLDMPAGTGLDVVRVLHHELPEVRVIACSAEPGDEPLDWALREGAQGALRMPFQVPELVDLVDTVAVSS